jgi:hypothetical protein
VGHSRAIIAHTMLGVVGDFVAVLQEESERVCGTALPVELVLAILVEWGGMRSPTAVALRTDPRVRGFRTFAESWGWDRGWDRGIGGPLVHMNGGHCLCHDSYGTDTNTGIPVWVENKYITRTTKALNAQPQAGPVRRVPGDKNHLIKRVFMSIEHMPMYDNWYCGAACGRVGLMLCFHGCGALGSDDVAEARFGERLREAWANQTFGGDRAMHTFVGDLAQLVDEWWDPRCAVEGRRWWKPFIETLQGQPMTTEMESRAHAWELYLRADRGEIV